VSSGSGGYHLIGHRVEVVRFRDRTVECECGIVIVSEDNESRIIRDAALADAFGAHRRTETAKQRAEEVVPHG
jgi:hypothetical protein